MGKKKKERKLGICAICGTEAVLTSEHVPPRNLFLPPRPTNTITTWTCIICNEDTKLDDEYFRLFVTAGAEPKSRAGQLWRQKVVESTFARSPALKTHIQDDREWLRQHHKTEPVKTYSGETVPDELVERCLMLDASRINRVAEKVVRCLYFHHHRQVLPRDLTFHSSLAPISIPKLEEVICDRKGLVGGKEGEFIYWYRFSDPNRYVSEWVLLFYLQNHITVFTGPNASDTHGLWPTPNGVPQLMD